MNLHYIQFRSNQPYMFSHQIQNNLFRINLRYDIDKDRYFIDIYKFDGVKYNLIIGSIFLTVGCNLLLQYQHFGLGNLWVIPMSDKYYGNVNSGIINNKEIFGSYPAADTIKNNYFLLWEHED